MPLLSKICPVCGYVEEGGEDGVNVGQLVTKLEGTLREIKGLPEPSFSQGMSRLAFVIWPIATLFMLILAVISDAGFFWIFFGIFLILALVAVAKKARGKSAAAKMDKQFVLLKHDFEHNERLAKHSFGKSREVMALIDEIGEQIRKIEKNRKAMAAKNMLVWLIVLVAIFGAAGWGVMAINKSLNDPEAVADRVHRRIQEYAQSGISADDTAQERIDLVKSILESELSDDTMAEQFFFNHCMGQLKDLECAQLIVNYYTAKGETDAAKAFIDKCTGMRYNSDKNKLKQLL